MSAPLLSVLGRTDSLLATGERRQTSASLKLTTAEEGGPGVWPWEEWALPPPTLLALLCPLLRLQAWCH